MDTVIEGMIKALGSLPKEVILYIIFLLMRDDKITFADIVNQHIKHLEAINKAENEKMVELQSRVMAMWCGNKKDLRNNLKECVRYLKDLGRINITNEQIDKY